MVVGTNLSEGDRVSQGTGGSLRDGFVGVAGSDGGWARILRQAQDGDGRLGMAACVTA